MSSIATGFGAIEAIRTATVTRPWGWFPQLFLVGSVGLAAVAVGSNGARVGGWWGEPVFWLGITLVYGPVAIRLLMEPATRIERIALVAFVGVSLFVAKHLGNPLAFERYDELLHLRTLDNIIVSGQLFTENPLLPISSYYPGLEVVTSAIVQITGVSYVGAGAIVLAMSRLALVLALFLAYELITSSPRVASVGALLYMTHPNFVYFNAAYAYESLAIPLAVGLLYLILRQGWDPLSWKVYLPIVALLSFGVSVTHHLTTLAFIAFLAVWALFVLLGKGPERRHVLWGAGVYVAIAVLWSTGVAGLLLNYLGPVIDNAVSGLLGLLTGTDEPRELFVSRRGDAQPLWSMSLGLAAPILVTLLVLGGLWITWQRVRAWPPTIAVAPGVLLAVVALGYPASLAFRLTSRGAAHASGRSAEFLFIGVGVVAALALVGLWQVRRWDRLRAVVGGGLCVVALIGGVIVGTPDWSRIPRPYTPGADARSIEEHGLAVAAWAEENLPREARVAGDRMTRTLIGAHGGQYMVSQASVGVPIWPLFFSTDIDGRPMEIINSARVEYIVIDRRLVDADTHTVYIESGEQFRIQEGPLRQAAVRKWERAPRVSRLYDNGAIFIYDLRRLHVEP